VSYSATTAGGIAPVAVSGSPASGSAFPVGTTSVTVTASSSDGQTASCSFTVTVTYVAPVAPTSAGPQPAISCPTGAVDIWPGISIQGMVNANAGSTTFCLKAGVHQVTSSITPKTGDTFVGEYGAILDGSGWTATDDTQAAFQASNEDINNVTIRNLVIRQMPQKCIYANSYSASNFADNWLIEYNELTGCRRGIVAPNTSRIRWNNIHHNTDSGYGMLRGHDTVFEFNELAYNGRESKIVDSDNITFRSNWVHHNKNGIWYDTSNAGSVVENNTIEDNEESGVNYEIGFSGIVRNNLIRRNGEAGIIIISSQDLNVYGNTVQDNFRGIQVFLNCDALVDGFDLKNNSIHDNAVRVPSSPSRSYGVMLSHVGSCSLTAYSDRSKNNTYVGNAYTVPNTFGNWFYWEANKTWSEWQAVPQDVTGTLNQ
jgi:parallel beta-helix repeat protein